MLSFVACVIIVNWRKNGPIESCSNFEKGLEGVLVVHSVYLYSKTFMCRFCTSSDLRAICFYLNLHLSFIVDVSNTFWPYCAK